MDFKERYCRKNYCHYEKSNFISKLFFNWLNPVVKISRKKPFEQDMHYNLPNKYKIKNSTKKFNNILKNNKYNILKGVIKFINNKTYILLSIILIGFINFINGLIFAEITLLTNNINNDNEIPIALKKVGYYCIGLLIIELIVNITNIHFGYYFLKLSLLIKNNLIYLIIKKNLRLSQKGLNLSKEGEIINLIQIDSQKIEDNISSLLYTIFILSNSIFSLFYTFIFAGWIVIIYIILFIVFFISMLILIILDYNILKKIRKINDKTSSLLENIFLNIKFIKFNVLENYITKKIYTQKLKEIKMFKKLSLVRGSIIFSNWFNPKFTFFIMIICFKFLNKSAKIIFPILRLISQIDNIFIFGPYFFQYYYELKISFDRIQNFINIKENNIKCITNINDEMKTNISIKINGNFKWGENSIKNKNFNKIILKKNSKVENIDNKINFELKNINLEFKKGSLNFIIDKSSSGKSSLFYSILGELNSNNDSKIEINEKISISPQNYFLQSKSIKKNILFYDKYEKNNMKKVIDLCYLGEDLKMFENGIETEIGDQSVNISSGQKARISLARCLYKNKPIIILDDIFSSLDNDLSIKIMKNTILKELKNKTRIIISNSTEFLNYADNIIYIEDGEIKYNGNKSNFFNSEYYKIFGDNNNYNLENYDCNDDKGIGIKNYLEFKNDKNKNFIIDEDKVKKRNLFKSLSIYLKNLGGYWTSILILMISIFFCYTMFMTANYIQEFSSKNDFITNKFLFYLFLLKILPTILPGFKGFLVVYLTANLSKRFHNEMMYRILHSKIGEFLDRIPISRLLNRFTKDIYNIEKILSHYYITIIIKSSQTILCYYAIINSSQKLYLIIILIIFIIYSYFIQKLYIKVSKDASRLEAITKTPILNLSTEIIKNTYLFKNFKKKDDVKNELKKWINENTKNGILLGGISGWFTLRITLTNILIIQLISYMILIFSKKVTKNSFKEMNITIFFILQMVGNTIDFWKSFSSLENNLVNIERCEAIKNVPLETNYFNYEKEKINIMNNIENINDYDLIYKKSKNFESNLNINYSNINRIGFNKKLFQNGHIKFENIYAKYPTCLNNVLIDLNFEIIAKEKIGIIGRSGSGKSTILKLLTQNLKNISGTIKIDNYDISKLELKKLRSEIFFLNKDNFLFEGTLLENINLKLYKNKIRKNSSYENDLNKSLINKNIDSKIKYIKNILKKLGFNKNKLKNKLNYKIERNGKNLSEGEKQIINFTKAIISKSKILLFDEITSCIDYNSEKIMFDSIFPWIENKTLIMITHRLNVLLKFDKILTIEKGKIADFRNVKDLLSDNNSYFKKLLI